MTLARVLWPVLVVILAGARGPRLGWPGMTRRDRIAWHEAAHLVAGWGCQQCARGAAVVQGGGATSWGATAAGAVSPAELESDSRKARRVVGLLLELGGVASDWRAGLYLIRAARREADARLRLDFRALRWLALELGRQGVLGAAELEAAREQTRAGLPMTDRDRKAEGLPELEDLLTEARRRWPAGSGG